MIQRKWIGLIIGLLLVTGIGNALASEHNAPSVLYSASIGDDNELEKATGIAESSSTVYRFGNYNLGTAANDTAFYMNTLTFASSTNTVIKYAAVPQEIVGSHFDYYISTHFVNFGTLINTSGSDEVGYVVVRSSGTNYANTTIGSGTYSVTNINHGTYLTAGTNSGEMAVVGKADDDILLAIINLATPNVIGSTIAIDGGGTDVAYGVYQLSSGNLLIGGYTDAGSDKNFYLIESDQAGSIQSTVAGLSDNGDNDVIREIISDGSDIYVVGTTGDEAALQGYVAKLNSAYELQWEYETSTSDGSIELFSIALDTDGDPIAVGHIDDDLYVVELRDADGSVDFAQNYDTDSNASTAEVGTRIIRKTLSSGFAISGHIDEASGSSTNSLIVTLSSSESAPPVVTTPSPANAATDQDAAGVTLSWVDPGTGGDAATGYEVMLDAGTNPPTTEVTDAVSQGTTTSYATGALSYGTTYYWQIISVDADGDTTLGTVWSFSTPTSTNYIELDVATTTYVDNDNKAGFVAAADDGYDDEDVPEPPAPANSYVRAYWYESGFSLFTDLTENWYALTGKDLDATTYQFPFTIDTDEAGDVDLTFDATTGNANGYGAVLWYAAAYSDSGEYQNLSETATYQYTSTGSSGSPDSDDFVLLFGGTTAPTVAATLPPNGDLGIPLIRRGSNNDITLDFDELNPIRRVKVFLDEDSSGTFVAAYGTNEITYATLEDFGGTFVALDDPTADAGGDASPIDNPDMAFQWNPVAEGVMTSTEEFANAVLRFITEDYAGNKDTLDYNIEIGPDVFSFTGDYGAGWHLISLPLIPDAAADHPDSLFTTATGDDNGIAGDFAIFQQKVATGATQVTDMETGYGYWLALDEANTAAATNAGLGDVEGSVVGAAENVDVTIDANAWNYIGVPMRTADLDSGRYNPGDMTFSIDDFTTPYTWTEVTTTADKGGDTEIWISPTSVMTYDNAGGDYATAIAATDSMDPGVGYTLQASANAPSSLKMRINRTTAMADGAAPPISFPQPIAGGQKHQVASSYFAEWSIPITVSMGDYTNTLSKFGTHPEATDGWDAALEESAPPLPPTGYYARAYIDGAAWNTGFGRWYVADIRSPFNEETMSAQWKFGVFASDAETVTMSFDVSMLEELEVPDEFHVYAQVGDQQYDLREVQSFSFEHSGGGMTNPVEVTLVAYLEPTSGIGYSALLPEKYALERTYPNPFNPSTTIRIALPETANLKVTVYNILGKQVAVLADGQRTAGWHNIQFNANGMASGVYFVRAQVPGELNEIRKIVLVR